MPLKDADHRCPKGNKIIFPSRAAAEHGLRHFKSRARHTGKRREPMEAYPCSFCSAWHVGHASQVWR